MAMLDWFDSQCPSLKQMAMVKNLVLPGDVLSQVGQFVRGYGTYMNESGQLVSSVPGIARQVNKLICVEPLMTTFIGQVGDTVIGRVTEVLQRRWKLDINARRQAVLPLTGVNLPGGELRRKSEEDERLMRTNLCEGDLISAEVQSVYGDGSLALQTRSLKYGKLFRGVLIKVPPYLIKRCRFHFVTLPCGAFVIFALNGFVWLSQGKTTDTDDTGSFVDNAPQMEAIDFDIISRLRMCVLLHVKYKLSLYYSSLHETYTLSLRHSISELCVDAVTDEIAESVRRTICDGKLD